MDRASILFCVISLALSLLVAVFAFPLATITRAELDAAQTVTAAEQMGELELGEFGQVMILDLVDYYIENPPTEVEGAAPVRQVRFQGC
ncbi:MAG: hypothetical protein GY703_14170 [Gammaproteobacteria bacterium]|nr:hypothetical protein [Gammaproteobacteria bacterium]